MMKLLILILLAVVGQAFGQACRCEMCEGASVANPDMIVTIEEEAATCAEWYAFMCNFAPPNGCDVFQAGTAGCCGGAAGDNPPPEVGASEEACPDGTGCDICPDGTIADDSKVVTWSVPDTGATETATCAEWFLFGCTFAEADICTDLQTNVADCCSTSLAGDETGPPTEAPPPTQAPTSSAARAGIVAAGAAIALAMLA